jgi:LPXTG-site transpeptidase (sortase) family protein
MSEQLPTKKYPASTDETAKMLGLQPSSDALAGSSTAEPQHNLPIANLPVAPAEDHNSQAPHGAPSGHAKVDQTHSEPVVSQSTKTVKVLKAALPYIAIFAVGLFLYYFFFTSVNFGKLFSSSAPKVSTPQTSAVQALEAQDLTAYNTWIAAYYYDVSDPAIIAPDTDNSGNGLSNFQKYLLNLNPKAYDTLGLGMADSQTLAAGLDPATDLPLSQAQKDIVSKYIDMEVVMNRLTLSKLQNPPEVAGASTSTGNNSVLGNPFGASPAADTGSNVLPTPTPTSFNSPVTGANLTSPLSANLNINTSVPGKLSIPDLKISAPILWPTSSSDFDTDLESGVIHYPGTALPGQIGTTYIAGHSSNYVWAKGDYNHIFTYLDNLKDNASFSITVTLNNGKTVTLDYVVVNRQEFLPTDPAQVANTGQSLVALSTCWPVNTTSKRLVLYGQLTQIEQ